MSLISVHQKSSSCLGQGRRKLLLSNTLAQRHCKCQTQRRNNFFLVPQKNFCTEQIFSSCKGALYVTQSLLRNWKWIPHSDLMIMRPFHRILAATPCQTWISWLRRKDFFSEKNNSKTNFVVQFSGQILDLILQILRCPFNCIILKAVTPNIYCPWTCILHDMLVQHFSN